MLFVIVKLINLHTEINVDSPLLPEEKSSSFQFSPRCILSLGYFLCFRQCPAEQLPGLTDKCASCGRSYFGDVDATDASVFPPSYTEEKRRLSSERRPDVEA